jgi:hypothetical protein
MLNNNVTGVFMKFIYRCVSYRLFNYPIKTKLFRYKLIKIIN